MKFKMEERTFHGRKCIRFVAKIAQSKKHGIPRSTQKTWRAFTDDSMYEGKDIKSMFMSEARRWHHKVLLSWFGSPEKFPQQQEIHDVCNETSEQGKSVPSVPETGLVSGGEVTGPVHEDGVKPTEGAG